MKKQVVVGICLAVAGSINAAEGMGAAAPSNDVRAAEVKLSGSRPAIWDGEVGAGFRRSTEHVGLVAGAGLGLSICGSSVAHQLALAGVSYGQMWGGTKATNHWWRGNFEWRVEMIGASEFSPSMHCFVGLTPHVRYNFATGTRWIPFVGFGTGVSVTSIGQPDLGGPFQFNSQVSLGMNYFLRDNLALSLEGRMMHVSSAGFYQPNDGMNNLLILVGVNWFF